MSVWIILAVWIAGAVAFVSLFVAVIKSCRHEWSWQQQLWDSMSAYDASHPPITDEEFLKLCGPDVSPEVALKVREIIAEVGCIEKSRIYPDARIVQDLGLC